MMSQVLFIVYIHFFSEKQRKNRPRKLSDVGIYFYVLASTVISLTHHEKNHKLDVDVYSFEM